MKNVFNNIFDYVKSYWFFLLPHHLFSRFTYIITRTKHPLTHVLISLYIKLFNVNMNECERELIKEYNTFCDFFTRKLKTGVHKIDKGKNSIVSSCDGKILEFGEIKNHSPAIWGRIFWASSEKRFSQVRHRRGGTQTKRGRDTIKVAEAQVWERNAVSLRAKILHCSINNFKALVSRGKQGPPNEYPG